MGTGSPQWWTTLCYFTLGCPGLSSVVESGLLNCWETRVLASNQVKKQIWKSTSQYTWSWGPLMPVPLGQGKENDFIFIEHKPRTRIEPWKHTSSVITVKRENYNNDPRILASRNQIPKVRLDISKPHTLTLNPLPTHIHTHTHISKLHKGIVLFGSNVQKQNETDKQTNINKP